MQTEKNAAAALSAEDFKVVGFTQEEANRIERPTISYWQDAWRRLKKNPIAMASLAVLAVLIVLAVIGPVIRGYDYVTMNVPEKNQGASAQYWWGTDALGRDLFSRVWVGARVSILVALVVGETLSPLSLLGGAIVFVSVMVYNVLSARAGSQEAVPAPST